MLTWVFTRSSKLNNRNSLIAQETLWTSDLTIYFVKLIIFILFF